MFSKKRFFHGNSNSNTHFNNNLPREHASKIVQYTLGAIADMDLLELYRPPIYVRRLKKTLLVIKTTKEQVKALIQWRENKGAKVDCPLTRAWLGFASKETLLSRELLNMSVHLQESSMEVETADEQDKDKKKAPSKTRPLKPASLNTPVHTRS